MSRQRFSALALIRRGLSGHRGWQPQWRKACAATRLRCRHRRRRRPRPGRRLLSGEGARARPHRRARERLDRRRQHRPQHHHHPLQLSVRGKRRTLRSRGQDVGGPVASPQLQRHVLAARRDDARAYACTTCRSPSATSTPIAATASTTSGSSRSRRRRSVRRSTSRTTSAIRCSAPPCSGAAARRGTTPWPGAMRAPPTRSASTSSRTAR